MKLGLHDKKTLTKEVKFGEKFTAKMVGTAFYYNTSTILPEFIVTMNVEIYDNKTGERLEKTTDNAKKLSSDTDYDRTSLEWYIKRGMPFKLDKVYSRVGQVFCVGDKAYNEVNNAREDIKEKLYAMFGEEFTSLYRELKSMKNDNAKEVIEAAEKQGLENLMTNAELKVWRKNYNNLHNEGEEGYIPSRISLEQYNKALEPIK